MADQNHIASAADPFHDSIHEIAADLGAALSTLQSKFDRMNALLQEKNLRPSPSRLPYTPSAPTEPSASEEPRQTSSVHNQSLEEQPNRLSPNSSVPLSNLPSELSNDASADSCGEDKTMPIAIVGMACRFPQDATNPEKLWDMLLRKQSARTEVPANRFNIDAFHHPNSDKIGMMSNRGGYFLKEDISAFDAPFFSISPAEARSMDPMQRILFEVVYEAMESSGISLDKFAGSNTGSFVGNIGNDYDDLLKRDVENDSKYHAIGVGQAMISNRVSFLFDLKGPSLTLDTACSSGLVAVHLACQSLRAGESKAAVVGATNLMISPNVFIGMDNMHFLSPDSTCFTFDSRANGYARGEGMAVIILKPLHDAIRDGDTIRGVIRGTASNQDGKTAGITLPSKLAQISLIKTAYEQAGCDPAETTYFEAHGTGTQAGDPLEAGAIGATVGLNRKDPVYVGSVKTNIGHLEGASGLAGLIKAVLSIENGVILPNLNFENGNSAIDFEGWNIKVPTEAMPWPVPGLRRASINSFGFGGTNCHTIIDDAYNYMKLRGLKGNHRTLPRPQGDSSINELLSLSDSGYDSDSSWVTMPETHMKRPRIFHLAAHEEGVATEMRKSYVKHFTSRVEKHEESFLDNLAYTLSERRSQLPWSCSVIAGSIYELVERLSDDALKPVRRLKGDVRLGFVFTGQGAQWYAMGRQLSIYSTFTETLKEADRAVKSFGAPWSLLDELNKDETESRINEAAISQPLCTAIQMALVNLYDEWGIIPTKVIGHSSGEIAAAYTIGALTVKSAMKVAFFRGLHSAKIKNFGHKGAMLAAGISCEEAERRIQTVRSGKVVVGCINSPKSVTLSGDESTIVELQQFLEKDGLFARRLNVDTAYHSHHMLDIAADYRDSMSELETRPSKQRNSSIEMLSSVTGESIKVEELNGEYWVKNMVSPVRFSDAMSKLCTLQTKGKRKLGNKAEVEILIEIGPSAALAGPVKQVLAGSKALTSAGILYFSTLQRNADSRITTLAVAASLFAHGYGMSLRAAQFPNYKKATPRVIVDLPPYPWNHSRKYWNESRLSLDYRFRKARNDVLGAPAVDWNPIEPTWRNFIRVSEQPWVKGHVVLDNIIYPAAGYISMALEAAKQISMLQAPTAIITGYNIRNLAVHRALVVPQSDEGVETKFCMRPYATNSITSSDNWHEFRLFSYTSTGGWAENCRGMISALHETHVKEAAVDSQRKETDIAEQFHAKLKEGEQICTKDGNVTHMYSDMAESGLYYSPEFQNITAYQTGDDKALGTIQVPDTKNIMPKEWEFPHILHPITMDNFLQMLIPALGQGDILGNIKEAYVPVFAQEIYVSAGMSPEPGHKFTSIAQAKFSGFRDTISNIMAVDADSLLPVIRIQGLKCTALTNGGSSMNTESSETKFRKHCGTVVWEPDVDLLSRPDADKILRDALTDDVEMPPSDRVANYELLAWSFLVQVLDEINESEVAGFLDHHKQFYRFMQDQRRQVLAGEHKNQTLEWTNLKDPKVASKIARLLYKVSDPEDREGALTLKMCSNLVPILRQEADPLELAYENDLLAKYYSAGLGVSMTYPQMERYITLLSHKYPDLDYLEIGAGTGGATVPTLHALSDVEKQQWRLKSYTYTDISSGFFETAGEKFKDWAAFMKYRKLDIEADPYTQDGFQDQQFDVVLACNVLHATQDMNNTMTNVRKLLKPGGKLILLEMTQPLLSVSLIFGGLPGWWASKESWRKWGPVMEECQWRDVLQNTAFTDFDASVPDVLDSKEHVTRLMVATAVGDVDRDATRSTPISMEVVLVTTDVGMNITSKELVNTAMATLKAEAAWVELCTFSNLVDVKGKIVVCFAELDGSIFRDLSSSEYSILKRVTQDAIGLLWITRGGTAKGTKPEMSIFQGMARSIRSEQPNFPCVTVDLDCNEVLPIDKSLVLLMKVFQQAFIPDKAHAVNDQEFIENAGVLHCKRAFADPNSDMQISRRSQTAALSPEPQQIIQAGRPLKLKVGTVGTLDSLYFEDDLAMADDAPLEETQVEVEVKAAGLNFRDILICIGELSDSRLGNECAGIVTKVGSRIHHLLPGDRVSVWSAESFSTKARTHGDCVQRIPDNMDFATAASLPVVYITVVYSFCHIARLERGQSVLIHAAAGGVGQAAIQVAKMLEAQIFVTVGSEEKKRFLVETYKIPEDHIFNSRDLSFASGVMSMTDGRGVDVVLNSLSDEALQASWKLVARFGTFVELGKKDIASNGRLEMGPFNKNITFASVDCEVVFAQNPRLRAQLFTEVMQLIRKGSIKAVSPLTVYPFSKTEEAFRLMQTGKHMGKIILEPQEGDIALVMPSVTRKTFPGDASYLLAGGLGGIGRSLSRWMVECGARNIIFVSRNGASNPEAVELVNGLIAAGARVEVLTCDIADEKKFTALLRDTLQSTGMPSIRGVIQAAMVLKDSIFANMSYETFHNTLNPKVQGSWTLHRATLNQPLDFFVLLSSASGFIGNAGQANYVAACTYQVALANHRLHLGLPATSIDIGKVAGVGFVEEHAGTITELNLIRMGMLDISEKEILAMIELGMEGVSNGHLLTGTNLSISASDNIDLPSWTQNPVFSHLEMLRPHLAKSSQEAVGDSNQQSTSTLLTTAVSFSEAVGHVLDAFCRKLSRSLMMAVEDIDANKSTSAYGVDSLVAVELRNWLFKEMQADIPVFEILQAVSLNSLAQIVAAKSAFVSDQLKARKD